MKNRIFAVLAICTVAIAAAQVRQATNDPLPVPGANDLPLLGKILPGYNNVDGTVGKVVDWDYIDGIPASLLTSQAETKTYWSNPTTYDPAGQRLTFTFDVQPSVFDPGDRIFFLSPDNLDDSEDVFVVDDGLRSDRELIDADRFLLSPLDIKANRYTEVFFGYHANGQTAWVLNQSILVASGRYTRYIVAKIGDDNVDFPTAADFLNTADRR